MNNTYRAGAVILGLAILPVTFGLYLLMHSNLSADELGQRLVAWYNNQPQRITGGRSITGQYSCLKGKGANRGLTGCIFQVSQGQQRVCAWVIFQKSGSGYNLTTSRRVANKYCGI